MRFANLGYQLGDYMMCNARKLCYPITDERFLKDFEKFKSFGPYNEAMGPYGSAGGFIRGIGAGIMTRLHSSRVESEEMLLSALNNDIPAGMGRTLNLTVAVLYSAFLNAYYNFVHIEHAVMEPEDGREYEKGSPLTDDELHFLIKYVQARPVLWNNFVVLRESSEGIISEEELLGIHKKFLNSLCGMLADNLGINQALGETSPIPE